MNRFGIIGLVASSAVVVAACAIGNPGREGAGSSNRELQQRVNVTQTYNEYCSKCHGTRGEGGGAGTQTLLTKAQFDQKVD